MAFDDYDLRNVLAEVIIKKWQKGEGGECVSRARIRLFLVFRVRIVKM